MDRTRHRHRQQRPNLSSFSSSSSSSSTLAGSLSYGSGKISANPGEVTMNSSSRPKARNFTPDNTGNSDRVPDWKHRRGNVQGEQVKEEEEDPNSVSSIVGTCPFMCPEGERVQRERLRDLAVFEWLSGNPGKTSADLAVKKFCRTISTKHMQASDVRPLPVLAETLNYLLSFLKTEEHPFEVVHDFIFDRTRSIRQDLSMQNIVTDKAIYMYEEMVKFHVISHHRLQSCGASSTSSMLHLNLDQLKKALTSLYNLYEANRDLSSIFENEAEFRSFYVLLHLDSDSQSMGESLSLWFRYLPSPIMKSKEMCFARRVLRFFRMGNYKRFLCTIASEASFLQYCIIERYITEVRGLAVSCINSAGYKLQPYPLTQLSKLLMMKESDVESFCSACGLEILTDSALNKLLPSKQTSFCHPKEGFRSYSFLGLERFECLVLCTEFIDFQ